MQLEDYFSYLGPLDIRVKGTRVGIHVILWEYLKQGLNGDQIAKRYPSLTCEQVYATLTYYWRNKEQVDSFLQAIEEEYWRRWREQQLNPSPGLRRLRALAEARDAAAATAES